MTAKTTKSKVMTVKAAKTKAVKMVKMNQTQFAAHFGVDKSRITQLKQAGRLVFTEDGKVDVEASSIRIAETADPNRDDVVARHADARGKDTKADEIGQIKPAKPKKEPKPHDPDQISFSEGRAKEQKFKALHAELEYKERIGELVPKEDMKSAVADMVTTFRQELENLPHRIAADLVAKDINAIRIALKQEMHAVLANLERECSKKIDSTVTEQAA